VERGPPFLMKAVTKSRGKKNRLRWKDCMVATTILWVCSDNLIEPDRNILRLGKAKEIDGFAKGTKGGTAVKLCGLTPWSASGGGK